jgi:hypothetical protein
MFMWGDASFHASEESSSDFSRHIGKLNVKYSFLASEMGQ